MREKTLELQTSTHFFPVSSVFLFFFFCEEDPSLSHLSGLKLMLALASHEYSALALTVIDYASLLTCQASVDSWAYFLAVAPLSPHVFSLMRRKLKF